MFVAGFIAGAVSTVVAILGLVALAGATLYALQKGGIP